MVVQLSDRRQDLARFEAFHATVYVDGFPDADSRDSFLLMRSRIERGVGTSCASRYRILQLVADERVLAAAVVDYLADANCGVIEFIIVDPAVRGLGYGRRLHDAAMEVLRVDASAAGFSQLDLMLIELDDPLIPTGTNEPFDRVLRSWIWHSWGYRRLDFPYVQPALSPVGGPVSGLVMAVRLLSSGPSATLPANVVVGIIHAYVGFAMSVSQPELDPTVRCMTEGLLGSDVVAVQALWPGAERERDWP